MRAVYHHADIRDHPAEERSEGAREKPKSAQLIELTDWAGRVGDGVLSRYESLADHYDRHEHVKKNDERYSEKRQFTCV